MGAKNALADSATDLKPNVLADQIFGKRRGARGGDKGKELPIAKSPEHVDTLQRRVVDNTTPPSRAPAPAPAVPAPKVAAKRSTSPPPPPPPPSPPPPPPSKPPSKPAAAAAAVADATTPAPALSPAAFRAKVKAAKEVGPGRYCSPRHPAHRNPSSLESNRPILVYRLGETPIQSCGQSFSAPRGKRYTEIGLLYPMTRRAIFVRPYKKEVEAASPATFQAKLRAAKEEVEAAKEEVEAKSVVAQADPPGAPAPAPALPRAPANSPAKRDSGPMAGTSTPGKPEITAAEAARTKWETAAGAVKAEAARVAAAAQAAAAVIAAEAMAAATAAAAQVTAKVKAASATAKVKAATAMGKAEQPNPKPAKATAKTKKGPKDAMKDAHTGGGGGGGKLVGTALMVAAGMYLTKTIPGKKLMDDGRSKVDEWRGNLAEWRANRAAAAAAAAAAVARKEAEEDHAGAGARAGGAKKPSHKSRGAGGLFNGDVDEGAGVTAVGEGGTRAYVPLDVGAGLEAALSTATAAAEGYDEDAGAEVGAEGETPASVPLDAGLSTTAAAAAEGDDAAGAGPSRYRPPCHGRRVIDTCFHPSFLETIGIIYAVSNPRFLRRWHPRHCF